MTPLLRPLAALLALSAHAAAQLEVYDQIGHGDVRARSGAFIDDLDGDGASDLLVGIPSYLDINFEDTDYVPGRVVLHTLRALDADAGLQCASGPNSTGQDAKLWHEGSLSLADDAFELWAWDAPAFQFGVFYYGPNEAEVPFGNGIRCIGSPAVRLVPVNSGDDGVARRLLPLAGAGILPGQPTFFQYWYRDPAAAGAGFDLTDAMRAVFVP